MAHSDKPCPKCGHCPTCGRSNNYPNQWWPWNPWWRPYGTGYPITVWNQTGSNIQASPGSFISNTASSSLN